MKNLGNMMKQAQQMQQRMQDMQKQLAQTEMTGQAGGGMVQVTVAGSGELRKIKLEKSVVDPNDIEMLEDLIVRYEEGMKLVKVCQERLSSAEQRIQIITRDHAGKPVLKDFEPKTGPTPTPAAQEKGETDHDEIRLF